MTKHLDEDVVDVLKKILHIGGLVEDVIDRALKSLLDRDEIEARRVIEGDARVDQLELEVEEKCLDVLALRQPVAIDLRVVTGILKINSDLERMADLAVNIAERAETLAKVPPLPFRPDVSEMATIVKKMVRDGLDALVRKDTHLAVDVWERDDAADRLYRQIISECVPFMRSHPDRIDHVLHLLGAVRNLERIADHATNIAEDVIFVVEGRIVRHRMRSRSGHGAGDAAGMN